MSYANIHLRRYYMKKMFLIPNLITAFGLACGLFVIFKVNMIEPGAGHFEVMKTSVILLLLAALADFIDGAIARVLKAESEFGVVFDSLADAVSFGVAPAVLVLKTLSLEQGTLLSFLGVLGCMSYSICGILRLVRFNTKKTLSKGDIIEMTAQKKNFTGLPIPAAAAAIVSTNLFLLSPYFLSYFEISTTIKAVILTAIMIVIGYLMVSKWKFPSFKALHFKVPSFHLAFLTVMLTIFLLYGILYFFSITLAVCAWGYILIAIVLSIIRLIAGKKSKTLEDFDFDDEDE